MTINELEAQFHRAMVAIYDRARSEINYVPTRFLQLVSEKGGVEAARQLVMSQAPSDGFVTLWEKRRLDLSVEYLVLEPQFLELFSEAERESARHRLRAYGFERA